MIARGDTREELDRKEAALRSMRLRRLPAWARRELEALGARVRQLEEARPLKANPAARVAFTRHVAGSGDFEEIELPETTTIRFRFAGPFDRIAIRFAEDTRGRPHLRVASDGGPLGIEPVASNVVAVVPGSKIR
jgi:hypothetical protein